MPEDNRHDARQQNAPQGGAEQVGNNDPQADDRTPDPKNAEAARYRRRLREVEAERDALRERLKSAFSSGAAGEPDVDAASQSESTEAPAPAGPTAISSASDTPEEPASQEAET